MSLVVERLGSPPMCIDLVRDVFQAVQLKRDVFKSLERISCALADASLHHRPALQIEASSSTGGAEKLAAKVLSLSGSDAPGRGLGSRSPLRNITNRGHVRENVSPAPLRVVQEVDGEGGGCGDVSIEGMEESCVDPMSLSPSGMLTDSSGTTLDESPSNNNDNFVDNSSCSNAADVLDELSSAGLMLRDLCLVYLESLSKARGGGEGGGQHREEEREDEEEEDEAREFELSDARRAILETILMAQEAEAASGWGGLGTSSNTASSPNTNSGSANTAADTPPLHPSVARIVSDYSHRKSSSSGRESSSPASPLPPGISGASPLTSSGVDREWRGKEVEEVFIQDEAWGRGKVVGAGSDAEGGGEGVRGEGVSPPHRREMGALMMLMHRDLEETRAQNLKLEKRIKELEEEGWSRALDEANRHEETHGLYLLDETGVAVAAGGSKPQVREVTDHGNGGSVTLDNEEVEFHASGGGSMIERQGGVLSLRKNDSSNCEGEGGGGGGGGGLLRRFG